MNQGDDPHLHDRRLDFGNVVDTPKYSSTTISKVQLFRNGGKSDFFPSFFLSTQVVK